MVVRLKADTTDVMAVRLKADTTDDVVITEP